MEGWVKIKSASQYCNLSERTLRSLLKQGLRFSRLPSGTILMKIQWLDQFLEQFEEGDAVEIDRVVDEIRKELAE